MLSCQGAALEVEQESLTILGGIRGESTFFHGFVLLRGVDSLAGHDAGGDVGAQLLARLHLGHDDLALIGERGDLALKRGQGVAGGGVDLRVDSGEASLDFFDSIHI